MVSIGSHDVEVIEYHGQRVVTFEMVDSFHQRKPGTARKRFYNNRKHFQDGRDYFHLDYEQLSLLRTVKNASTNGAYLMTESGYLMLVKTFRDNKAWDVQRQLVDGYFRNKQSLSMRGSEALATLADIAPALQALVPAINGMFQTMQLVVGSTQQTSARLEADAAALADHDVRLKKIEAMQTSGSGYVTILGHGRLRNIPLSVSEARQWGQRAKAKAKELWLKLGRVPDERWGAVGSYPIELLDELFADIAVMERLARE